LTVNPSDLTKPYPELATSYEVNSTGTVFTFTLRRNVEFASGDPLTSADVVFSLNRTKNINSFGAVVMTGLTVSAPDPYTVVLTSSTPNLAVPVIMTQSNAGILDSKLLTAHGGTADSHDNANSYLNSANMAGAGPYYVSSVDRSSEIVLNANPHFWGPHPAYSEVIIRDAPPTTQRLDIQDGQAQIALDISSSNATTLSGVKVVSSPSADLLLLSMNTNPSVSPATANSSVREAIKYGIDYKGVVALAGRGAVEATGFLPVGVLGSLPESDAIHQNAALARSDLQQSGIANPTVE
jgi:peptide/nickel transport system substrate-binding protein